MPAITDDILRADARGNVILPDGSKAPAAIAHALGYVVLNAVDAVAEVEARRARTAKAPIPPAPPPAVVAPPAFTPAEELAAALSALPEAAGKASSVAYLASTGMSLVRATRFLAGAPHDGAA